MKYMIRSLLAGIFCLFFSLYSSARSANLPSGDSCSLRVSLLTCGPGEDLYSAFGHIAVRVHNISTGSDYVFNYGTFDFSDPHFYLKFTRGTLLYALSVQDFSSFMAAYQEEQRSVNEQVLDISCVEKEAIWEFLQNNALPQNRFYKYNFFFDNCSTRIRDIFAKTMGNDWRVPDILPRKEMTFREIMDQYLAGWQWPRLGIDLIFGIHADAKMNSWQIMFLPDFLMKGLGSSSLAGRPVVNDTKELNASAVTLEPPAFYATPVFVFIVIGLLILTLTFFKYKGREKALAWVDRCLFFITGMLGCFMLIMWFCTDHRMCSDNMNLLWAFPPNLFFSFVAQKNRLFVKKYGFFIAVLNVILLLSWFLLPQAMPPAMIPLVLVLAVRGYRIYQRPLLPA